MSFGDQAYIHATEGCDFCNQCGFANHFPNHKMLHSSDEGVWGEKRGGWPVTDPTAAWMRVADWVWGSRPGPSTGSEYWTLFTGYLSNPQWDWRGGMIGFTCTSTEDTAGNTPVESLSLEKVNTGALGDPPEYLDISATSGGCNYFRGSTHAFKQNQYGTLTLNNMNFATRMYGLTGTDFDSTMAECNWPPDTSPSQTPPTDRTKNSWAGIVAVMYDPQVIRPNHSTGLFDHWLPMDHSASYHGKIYPRGLLNWNETQGADGKQKMWLEAFLWRQRIRFKIENRMTRKHIKGLRYNARIYDGTSFTDILEADHFFFTADSQRIGNAYLGSNVIPEQKTRYISPNSICDQTLEPSAHCVIPWAITQDGLLSGQTIGASPTLDRRQTIRPIFAGSYGDTYGDEVIIKGTDQHANPPRSFTEWGESTWPDPDCVVLQFNDPQ